MFKKLFLCLTLVLALTIGSSAIAMEGGQECTVIGGSKIIQVMNNMSLRGIVAPSDERITIGPELNETMVNNLNSQTGMLWFEGHLAMIEVDFGNGPVPVMIVVKVRDVKDCK